MSELEQRLRATLDAKAREVTAASLTDRASDDAPLATVQPLRGGAPRRPFSIAAALLAVVAIGTAIAVARNAGHEPRPRADTPPSGGAFAAFPTGRAWPLTNDEPLASLQQDLSTPDAVARTYVTNVIGLEPSWRLDTAVIEGDSATVNYILQDVPATITLRRDPGGLWFVSAAGTQLVSPGVPVLVGGGVDVSVAPGPRTYDSGSKVHVTALAADGRTLATADTVVHPVPAGASPPGSAGFVAVRWASAELAAAVRGDVLDDHDGNPATPDVVIGHWTAALDAPAVKGLPAGVDLMTAAPVLSARGSADDVALAYLRNRFPDYPQPGVKLERAVTRGGRAWAVWGTTDGGKGQVVLRRDEDTWGVVAATTDDVDLSDLRVASGRLVGTIVSTNINSLFADVLNPDGTPVTGAPRPAGSPGAAYRFGTAGGPGKKSLAIDVALDGPFAGVRVNLVGGTILSISEVTVGG